MSKKTYLVELAYIHYDIGHPFDYNDFKYFKRICKDDGYEVDEKDWQYYWYYFDECKKYS